jgi:hypothetical protein
VRGETETADCRSGVIRCRFGRDRLSTNVRSASIPTVNSGLWDLSRCANFGHNRKSFAPFRRVSVRGDAVLSKDALDPTQISYSVTALSTLGSARAESRHRLRWGRRNGQVWVQGRVRRLQRAASLRFSRALTRTSSRRLPWPAATRDWCCAKSAANNRANDPRH